MLNISRKVVYEFYVFHVLDIDELVMQVVSYAICIFFKKQVIVVFKMYAWKYLERPYDFLLVPQCMPVKQAPVAANGINA